MHHADSALKAADPAAAYTEATQTETEALLQRILATPAPRVSRRPRRRSVMAVATVALVAGAAVFGIGLMDGPAQQSAYAVTPKPIPLEEETGVPAAGKLRDIAARAEQLPAPRTPRDSVLLLQRDMWSLNTRTDGEQVTSRVVPQHVDIWLNPDGSGKRVTQEAGTTRTFTSAAPHYLKTLPTAEKADAAAMKAWVLSSGDGSSVGAFFNRYSEKSLDTVLAPAQRAGALRALASFKTVEYNGTVEDRAGRTGAAFSVESAFGGLPSKQTLIIDPVTGELLGYEEMLTSDPGKLNVKVPSVTQYVTYLSSAHPSHGA